MARSFPMGDGPIPTDAEQQVGRRKAEIDGTQFNRDPIFVSKGVGSKENPVEVPSNFTQRIVGVDDPETAQLVWFNLKKGPLHYLPGNFFSSHD